VLQGHDREPADDLERVKLDASLHAARLEQPVAVSVLPARSRASGAVRIQVTSSLPSINAIVGACRDSLEEFGSLGTERGIGEAMPSRNTEQLVQTREIVASTS
jgi:hypothetical protein